MRGRTAFEQAWRYAVVGLASNLALYAAYLLLTYWGLASKVAMTLLYAMGVIQTFAFNKRWSFGASGTTRVQFRRYCLAYGAGYLLNISGLFVLSDFLGWPHQLAQGILILVTAVLLFLLQKLWVFRALPPTNAPLAAP